MAICKFFYCTTMKLGTKFFRCCFFFCAKAALWYLLGEFFSFCLFRSLNKMLHCSASTFGFHINGKARGKGKRVSQQQQQQQSECCLHLKLNYNLRFLYLLVLCSSVFCGSVEFRLCAVLVRFTYCGPSIRPFVSNSNFNFTTPWKCFTQIYTEVREMQQWLQKANTNLFLLVDFQVNFIFIFPGQKKIQNGSVQVMNSSK